MIRVLLVFGTRPEAIKMAPVARALAARPGVFESRVCLTGQHREMLDQVMRCFDLHADHDLDLMVPGQTPADVAAGILAELPAVLRRIRPDVLLVQGDTTTTFAAALAAYLERIPVGHVEAGLRTGNFDQPFPEEMNRKLTSCVASIHFAPTARARDALLGEGVPARDILLTGNTAVDALLQVLRSDHAFRDPSLRALDPARPLVLITTHRRESFGAPLHSICAAVAELAKQLPGHDFVIPVHPNPSVRETVSALLSTQPNVHRVEPLEYREFSQLMARARLILTDSGGVQEEAPSLRVPVLVLREVTERPEGVEVGAARIVGTSQARIVTAASEILCDPAAHARMVAVANPYGDGRAGERIADALAERFGRP